jgi:hypothetical protein
VTVGTLPAHADPQEVELKYTVRDVDAVRALLDRQLDPGITAGPWSTRDDEDAYVDTDRYALAKAGFGARLRRRGSRFTLSLKSRENVGPHADGEDPGPAGSAALHRRVEIEGPATRSLDPRDWPESPARERLVAIVGDAPLRIRFVVQQRRSVRKLRDEDGHAAEVSLDEVRVRSGGKEVGSFAALEVEAIGDSRSLLDQMAADLESSGLVEPEPRSKEAIAAELVEAGGEAGQGGESADEEKARFKESRRFCKAVEQILGGPPDIVFEHVGKATFPTSVLAVKPFGKVVICGATSGYQLDFDVRYLWMRQKEILGSHFANAWEATKANELIEESKIRPVLWKTMGFEKVAEAHQLLRDNQHLGKIAILVGASEEDQGKSADGPGAIRAEVGA